MTTKKIDPNEKTEAVCHWRQAVAMGFKEKPEDAGGMVDYFLSHYELAVLELHEARDRILSLEADLGRERKKIRKAKKALRNI